MIDHKQFEGHSEGPWFDDGYRIHAYIADMDKRNGKVIFDYKYCEDTKPRDSALATVAPLLLAENKALRELVELMTDYIDLYAGQIISKKRNVDNEVELRAAIAKAKAALG